MYGQTMITTTFNREKSNGANSCLLQLTHLPNQDSLWMSSDNLLNPNKRLLSYRDTVAHLKAKIALGKVFQNNSKEVVVIRQS